jgi:hypothetical protein
VRLQVARAFDRSTAIRSGLPLRATCSQACALRGSLSLRIPARRARPARWLLLGNVSAAAVTDARLVVRLNPAGRRALQRRRSALTRLRLVATSGAARHAVAAWVALRPVSTAVR